MGLYDQGPCASFRIDLALALGYSENSRSPASARLGRGTPQVEQQDGATVVDSLGAARKLAALKHPLIRLMCDSQAV